MDKVQLLGQEVLAVHTGGAECHAGLCCVGDSSLPLTGKQLKTALTRLSWRTRARILDSALKTQTRGADRDKCWSSRHAADEML